MAAATDAGVVALFLDLGAARAQREDAHVVEHKRDWPPYTRPQPALVSGDAHEASADTAPADPSGQ